MRKVRLFMAGMATVVAACAVASAPASAVTLHWYTGGTKLAEGSRLLVMALGSLQKIAGTVAGVKVEIHCTISNSVGYLENPSGGAAGVGLLLTLSLSCEALGVGFAGCKIPGQEIHTRTTLHTDEINSEPVVWFLPDAPVNFGEVNVEGCTQEAVDGSYAMTGSALGKMDNATGEVTFKEPKAGGMFNFAGAGALFETIMEMLMEGGGKMEVKA